MKTVLRTALKLVLLTVLLFVCFSIAGRVSGMSESHFSPSEAPKIAGILVGICFIMAATLAYPVIRSKWRGWKLVLTMAAIFFGVMTFLSQIESIVFLTQLVKIISPEMVGHIFVQGIVTVVLFIPILVLVCGKMKGQSVTSDRLMMPWQEWVWKLTVLAVGYYVVYMTFGYFVAWQSPAVREYYKGLAMPVWMPFFQLIRGVIWVTLAVPVIKMMKGPMWEAGLAVGLLYSVLMGILLLMPGNVVMPDAVRLAHFKEIMSSNFLFGWMVVWVLGLGKRIGNGTIEIQA